MFSGSLSAALSEDAPVGTLALTVKARDADRAQPRDVILELVTSKFLLRYLSIGVSTVVVQYGPYLSSAHRICLTEYMYIWIFQAT